MDADRWERTKQILEEALRLAPNQRDEYLASACGDDGELRAEVESLIASYEEAGSHFMKAPAPEVLEITSSSAPPDRVPARVIGNYRLVREIGRGGMGQVWLAEQAAPVRRQVALKVVKGGLYDDSLLKRFQAERQSLASMNHPAIAKVFDAGATADGQPYFVMEYVQGLPITDYCDKKRLKIRDRLELMVKVCEGVQHAHQKAIIHRDLKPANILVQEVDGAALPRIIDFGLAKPTNPQVAGYTLYTHVGGFVGTPGYMSPEQSDPAAQDVDTRTDVYSLGVVLYVLLTGCLPFQTNADQDLPIDEMLRRLREDDPPRPSTKISSERELSSTTAEARGTAPKQLVSLLRGDLDWVAMKALEKDRTRRYATPSDLSADIRRYLGNEPVLARPASTGYRLRKYMRRHRLGVGIAASLVLLLSGFAVMQAFQLRRITRERDRANRITDFMVGMFSVSDPGEGVGNSLTAREVLDKASNDIDKGLAKDPDLQAQMMHVMGVAYLNLGVYSRAQSLFERSLQLEDATLGPKSLPTLRTMQRLAWTIYQQGRTADAERMQRKMLDISRRALGPEDPQTLSIISDLATTLDSEGNHAAAENMVRDVLEKRKRTLGGEDHYTLASMDSLAAILTSESKWTEAEALERQALAIQLRVFGSENLDTIHFMINEAAMEVQMEKEEEGEKLMRQALNLERRVLGPDQPETAVTVYNLACLELKRGQTDETLALLRQSVDHGLPPRYALGIEEDPDLKLLHGDSRFAALVAHVKERTPQVK